MKNYFAITKGIVHLITKTIVHRGNKHYEQTDKAD